MAPSILNGTRPQVARLIEYLAPTGRPPARRREPPHVFKSVIDFVPVYLKSNERIDALAFLGYLALLMHALIERDLVHPLFTSTTVAVMNVGERQRGGEAQGGLHTGELHRVLSWGMLVVVVGLIPWTAYLAISLPGRFQAHDWSLAWVGFDTALIAVLAYTAWAAWFRRQILAPTAIVAATMLLCDAWFDVTTSFGTRGEVLPIVTAMVGNVPLALFFIWLARRIMLRTAVVVAVAAGDGTPPQRARDVAIPFAPTWHRPNAGGRPTVPGAEPGHPASVSQGEPPRPPSS